MLTGCRKGEVLTLRWSDYRGGHLFLRGSKTGPRTVCLSQAACHVLERIPRTSAWAFPARRADRPRNRDWLAPVWCRVREEAGQSDLRIHDLRHTYASRALALGESLPVIGKLLGHSQVSTTARYAHLMRDAEKEAATRVGDSIGAHIGPRSTEAA